MPGREIPLVTEQVYHVVNRGTAGVPIFKTKRDYTRFLETMEYYQNEKPFPRFSKFLVLSTKSRGESLSSLKKLNNRLIKILAFCLMPNHFHLLVLQEKDEGVSKFLSQLTNSYTRYFNTKNNRIGPLLQGKFKAVRIEDDEQLLHVTRYIHLNPYTGFVAKTLQQLLFYPYSSLPQCLNKIKSNYIEKDMILSSFKNKNLFKKFTLDQASYQRVLGQIKHLALEE